MNDFSAEIGDTIQFGGYDWRVLDIKDGGALIISERILMNSEYGVSSAWADCDLRQTLNGPFYDNTFTEEEKAIIVETKIIDAGNQLYGASNGADTADKVFLLSAEEVVRYFGDSGQLADGLMYINDEYNPARTAKNQDGGAASWWWLRAPGGSNNLAVCVGDDGGVYVTGHGITTGGAGSGGVRPAVWIRIE